MRQIKKILKSAGMVFLREKTMVKSKKLLTFSQLKERLKVIYSGLFSRGKRSLYWASFFSLVRKRPIKLFCRDAQTILEYTMLFGILTSLLIAMTPLLRQGIQGMVKGVADQIGIQQNADQRGGSKGYLVNYLASTSINREKNVRERLGDVTYNFITDETSTQSETFSIIGVRDP